MDAVRRGSKGRKKSTNPVQEIVKRLPDSKDIAPEEMNPNMKQALSDAIENQVAEFLANGGKIEQVPTGESSTPDYQLSKDRKYWKEINYARVNAAREEREGRAVQ